MSPLPLGILASARSAPVGGGWPYVLDVTTPIAQTAWTPPAGTTQIVFEGWGEAYGGYVGGTAKGTLAYSGQPIWYAFNANDGLVGSGVTVWVTNNTLGAHSLGASGGDSDWGQPGSGVVLGPLTGAVTGTHTGAARLKITCTNT